MIANDFDYRGAIANGYVWPRLHTDSRIAIVNMIKARAASWRINRNNQVQDNPHDATHTNRVILSDAIIDKMSGSAIAIIQDPGFDGYWWWFQRFCVNNNLAYKLIDIHRSSWIDELEPCQFVVWRPSGSPWDLEEARTKAYFIQEHLHKKIFPSYEEVLFYENKILQYEILRRLGFPVIETFVSYDYQEALAWIRGARYPFISKIVPGASSWGIKMISSRLQAELILRRVFGAGRPTYWPSHRQKNYVFFQRFIENQGFDLRIIIVDSEHIFGYYRTVPSRDFRASGLGAVIFGELPAKVVSIAHKVAEALDYPILVVDFIISAADSKPYIVEASVFIQVDIDTQLFVGGVPGKYALDQETGQLKFAPGRYWLPELGLRRFLEKCFKQVPS